MRPPPSSTLFPYTTLFRSPYVIFSDRTLRELARSRPTTLYELRGIYGIGDAKLEAFGKVLVDLLQDRKSTRLNSSHGYISYAVFRLKKKIASHARGAARRG